MLSVGSVLSSTSIKQYKNNCQLVRHLLGGSVGIFVGDFSRNLPSQGKELISSCQQGIILHTELSSRFVNSELYIQNKV